MTQTLRGVVLTKYRNIAKFAIAIGWKRGKASRIVNGTTVPTSTDICELAKCLCINNQELFLQIFYPTIFG